MIRRLDEYLDSLDAAQTSGGMAFVSQNAKDRHETLLTYAERKHAAATYHLKNVRTFLDIDAKRMNKDMQESALLDDEMITESSSTLTRTADEYAYELSAFIEALKSAIDLLAEASSFYLRGVNVNYSISPLLKLSQKGAICPIINEVKDNSRWLSSIREYRHHLVHRLMPSLRTGHAIRSVGKITSSAIVPVVVPSTTPQYEPDTRKARLAEQLNTNGLDGLPGISILTERGIAKLANGKEETVHFSTRILPAEGYMRIEQFMKENLETFERFAEQLIKAFLEMKFRTVTVSKMGDSSQSANDVSTDPT